MFLEVVAGDVVSHERQFADFDLLGSRSTISTPPPGSGRTAKTVAHEAGDSKLRAWVLSEEAYSHYYGGNLVEAVNVAGYAQHVANQAPCSGAALAAALEARVQALFGKTKETYAALDRAEKALGGLEPEARAPSTFGYNEAKFTFHFGSAYTNLGKTTAALDAQQRALDLHPAGDYFNRALIMLDRAECLLRDNDVPAATDSAIRALQSIDAEQRNPVIDNRARQVLDFVPTTAAELPEVQELHEALAGGGAS